MSLFTDNIDVNYGHRHPGVVEKLKAFDNDHLSLDIRQITIDFKETALVLVSDLPDSAWLTSALHKLWEAKNEAVMAYLSTQK